jgi:hypothetical protein
MAKEKPGGSKLNTAVLVRLRAMREQEEGYSEGHPPAGRERGRNSMTSTLCRVLCSMSTRATASTHSQLV